jgi:molybdopterin synthase catalytic subunit
VHAPTGTDTWVGLSREPLPVGGAYEWAVRPDCGAVVLFSGTARDHSEGRSGVSKLEYEAYDEQVEPRLRAVADEARRRWPSVANIALLHRTGELALGDTAVIVVVAAPHRGDAFAAARYCIDAVKETVPIWKHESWDGGANWGLEGHQLVEPSEVSR